MNENENEKERERAILEHIMGCFILSETARGYHTPEHPKGLEAAAMGFHWPIAFWNTDGECWMMRDIATDPTVFDPFHDMCDAWQVLETMRAKPETSLDWITFKSILENRLDKWWSLTSQQFCEAICQAALDAVNDNKEAINEQ